MELSQPLSMNVVAVFPLTLAFISTVCSTIVLAQNLPGNHVLEIISVVFGWSSFFALITYISILIQRLDPRVHKRNLTDYSSDTDVPRYRGNTEQNRSVRRVRYNGIHRIRDDPDDQEAI